MSGLFYLPVNVKTMIVRKVIFLLQKLCNSIFCQLPLPF
jgi:hypothetical protein